MFSTFILRERKESYTLFVRLVNKRKEKNLKDLKKNNVFSRFVEGRKEKKRKDLGRRWSVIFLCKMIRPLLRGSEKKRSDVGSLFFSSFLL